MTVVDRIKIIATKRGLSLTDIERQSGLTIRTIYKWDKNSPSVDKALAVANFLNISLYWLFTGKDEHYPENDEFFQRYELLSDSDKEKISNFMDISLINRSPVHRISSNRIIAVLGYAGAGTFMEGLSIPIAYISPPGSIHADYVLIARGNCINSVIQDGEYIFVKNCISLKQGDIGIFYINGEVICGVYDAQQDYKIQGKVILTEEQLKRYSR